jgi:hypothetical protein
MVTPNPQAGSFCGHKRGQTLGHSVVATSPRKRGGAPLRLDQRLELRRPYSPRPLPLIDMPSEKTQFTRENVPARKGLPPNERNVHDKPISFRPYVEDLGPLNTIKDKGTFLRDAVHSALLKLNGQGPAEG